MSNPTPSAEEARGIVEAYWRQDGPRGESVRRHLPLQFKEEIVGLITTALAKRDAEVARRTEASDYWNRRFAEENKRAEAAEAERDALRRVVVAYLDAEYGAGWREPVRDARDDRLLRPDERHLFDVMRTHPDPQPPPEL